MLDSDVLCTAPSTHLQLQKPQSNVRCSPRTSGAKRPNLMGSDLAVTRREIDLGGCSKLCHNENVDLTFSSRWKGQIPCLVLIIRKRFETCTASTTMASRSSSVRLCPVLVTPSQKWHSRGGKVSEKDSQDGWRTGSPFHTFILWHGTGTFLKKWIFSVQQT